MSQFTSQDRPFSRNTAMWITGLESLVELVEGANTRKKNSPLTSGEPQDDNEVKCVNCVTCKSDSVATIPAEIRLYRNSPVLSATHP